MNEITFTTYQSQVFTEVERLLRTNGYKAKPLFEDTYVISKRVAEIIQSSTPSDGVVDGLEDESIRVYNILLGITVQPTEETATVILGPDVPVTPPVVTPTTYTLVLIPTNSFLFGNEQVTVTYTGQFGIGTTLSGITSQNSFLEYRILSSTEPGFTFRGATTRIQSDGEVTQIN